VEVALQGEELLLGRGAKRVGERRTEGRRGWGE